MTVFCTEGGRPASQSFARRGVWLSAVLLTACATPDPVRVSVPVAVVAPCAVDVPPRPHWAVDDLPLGAGVGRQMQALRADRHQALGHISALEGALEACRAQ